MSDKKLRVSIFEDNNSLRASLVALIKCEPGFELVGNYPNPGNIIKDLQENTPDVILMDIEMPVMTGIEAVALVRNKFPSIKVIMQTVFDDDHKVFHSICNGAVGYILKNSKPSLLIDAIREAAEGGAPMTPSIAIKVLHLFREQFVPRDKADSDLSTREKEILSSLTKGNSYKMIGIELSISIDTVRFHIKNIYEKLHVHSMTEAVSKALRENLI